jgi:serine/threonine protein phosphatase PrpC
MVCTNCGATLRPHARFCNVCGADQSAPETSVEQPTATGEHDAASEGGEGGEGGKQKRPPRIPRHRDDDAAEDVATAGERAATPMTATAVAESAPPVDAAEHVTVDDDSATLPETPTPPEVSEMPTQEHPILAPIPSAPTADTAAPAPSIADVPQAEPLDEPLPPFELGNTGTYPTQATQPSMPTPTDGLPWPLPPTIIVGGRYRVEELVRSGQTEHGPENVYRAHDLQAYEECWSCGAHHENATALDPYCDQCGADMLAREFVLIERLASDAPAAPTPQDEAGGGGDGETRTFTQGMRSYEVAPKPISAIHFPTGVRVSGYVTADDGRTRHGEFNEDSAALLAFDAVYNSRHMPRALGVVADGLGGHDSGQDASRLVVQSLLASLTPALVPNATGAASKDRKSKGDAEPFDGERLLREAARDANVALCQANDDRNADMGSTLVAVLIVGEAAWIANMGDSRGYVYDDHGLRRVTKDHSLVEQLIDAGMIDAEERYTHPQRNQILKSLGADPRLEADIFPQELRPGMRILLCSDGVWEMVRDDELARILRETTSTAEACERIVRAANENGGEDNISVVLLDASA